MKWIKRFFGLDTPLEKKKKQLSELRSQAFLAQRNGDLRKYGALSKQAEDLEDQIVEAINESR